MLTFLSINIEGFRSICEPTQLQLNTPGITWINSPTGSGKSTIFSAITWVLYGKDLKGVSNVKTWSKYQPKNYKGVCVSINYQTSKGVFKIIRCQEYKGLLEDSSKGNNQLLLYQDGYPIDIKGKVLVQKEIEKTIGLTHPLFINSIMFGQGLKRLIQESNTDKKKLFEEIFDLSFLNVAKDLANDERKELNIEVNDIEEKIDRYSTNAEEAKNTYLELRDNEKNWKENFKKRKQKLKAKRLELTKKLQETQKGKKENVAISLDTKINKTDNRLKELNQLLSEAKRGTQLNLETLVSKILSLLKQKEYEKAYDKLKKLRKAFKDISKYQEEKEELTQRKYNLREIKSKYDHLDQLCASIADNMCTIDKQIKDLESEKPKILSPKYKDRYDKYHKKVSQCKKFQKSVNNKLNNYNWLISDPLGNNGIKSYLFDSSLSILNDTLANYSDILGFRVSFEVDLESARKDFVTLIENNGVIIEYDELSGGERSLVNLAMALAMNETLTAARGVNLAFLDEVFEGISDDVLETAINLISKVFENKSLFLISHHSSLPLHKARIMQVVKQDGLSKILFT